MNNGISLIGVDKNLLLKQEKEIERLNKALLDIKEYIENNITTEEMYGNDGTQSYYQEVRCLRCEELLELLDIVNKALGSDKE